MSKIGNSFTTGPNVNYCRDRKPGASYGSILLVSITSPQKSVLCATVIFNKIKKLKILYMYYPFLYETVNSHFYVRKISEFLIFDWRQNRQYQRHMYWGNILYLFISEHRPIKCYYISSMMRMYRFIHTRCTNYSTVFSHFDVSHAA